MTVTWQPGLKVCEFKSRFLFGTQIEDERHFRPIPNSEIFHIGHANEAVVKNQFMNIYFKHRTTYFCSKIYRNLPQKVRWHTCRRKGKLTVSVPYSSSKPVNKIFPFTSKKELYFSLGPLATTSISFSAVVLF